MKGKRFTALLTLLTLLLALCACAHGGTTLSGEPTADAQTVTDLIGRTVSVTPGSYSRVVCIGAGALRVYSYIGDISLLCGVEDVDNLSLEARPSMFDAVARPYVLAYGDEFAALPSCGTGGPNAQTAEAEKILSCKPDIVLSFYADTEKADALQEQLGVPVIALKTGADGVFDEDFRQCLRLLGLLFDRAERAETLIAFLEAQTAEITARTADIPEEDRPGVYICGLGNWGTADYLNTAQNYVPFRYAGIRNVVTDLGVNGVQPIEAEKFTALAPQMDVVIFDAAAVKNLAPRYTEDPSLFDCCAAAETGEFWLQMAYNAYYTNYEISLMNTWFIAAAVYPDRFSDVDLTAKTNEITEAFLGVPLAEEIFSCPASYGGYGRVDPALLFQ